MGGSLKRDCVRPYSGDMLIRLLFLLLMCVGVDLQAIGTITRTFYDASRGRPLITTFWYPEPFASGKLYPLVVYSHESGGNRLEMAWLAEYLAEKGWIVAAVDHYGDTGYLKLPEQQVALWDRPKDLTALMLAMTTDPQFGPFFKQDKAVVIGYSTGALTGLWLTGGRVNKFSDKAGSFLYKDLRVRGGILLGPGHGTYFEPDGLKGIKVPILILGVQNDDVYPLAQNAMFYEKHIPNSKFVKMKGGVISHDFFLCPTVYQKAKLKKTILDFLNSIK